MTVKETRSGLGKSFFEASASGYRNQQALVPVNPIQTLGEGEGGVPTLTLRFTSTIPSFSRILRQKVRKIVCLVTRLTIATWLISICLTTRNSRLRYWSNHRIGERKSVL